MQVQGRQKMPPGDLLNAIDECRSINELFALVRREGIEIRMCSQSSASNIAYKPLTENPGVLPLETLKNQVREAATAASRKNRKDELIRAVEICPSIDKLFELVKKEHIVIRMESFSSASDLPQIKLSLPKSETSPLDRLKGQVMQALNETPRENRKEQLIRAVMASPTIDKLFELVKNEHIVIQMKSFSSASSLPQPKLPEIQLKPDTSPLDRLKEQVVQAVNDMPPENPNERLIRAVETCPTIDKLFELVKNEHIKVPTTVFTTPDPPKIKPSVTLPEKEQSPLERIREQILKAVTGPSDKHTKEQIVRAVKTCPTIEKLVTLVKNEHIKIPMTTFNSVTEAPRKQPPELQFVPEKSPLDRLKEKVIEAIKNAN